MNLVIGSTILWGPSQNQGLSVLSGCLLAIWFNCAGFGAKNNPSLDNPVTGMLLGGLGAAAYIFAAVVVAMYSPPIHAKVFAASVELVGAAASVAIACVFQRYRQAGSAQVEA